ncbi:ABC transporter permease [Solicola gregarius]|uniref:ABC3 transporter permease C-terminal domain-containing protein n=1 Tax=Solicola gregarius TaxID=2908642 RepID=A0AA46YMN3_9ACTN|nr:ABC transporter permease [Solicola gregarius]UYM05908.1 hypothetical protein L0C25_02215 [Solicola gregarius]
MRAAVTMLLRGVLHRWWLSAGIVALTIAAVVAGAIGPLYLSSSMTSLRVERIVGKSGTLRNLSWEFRPDGDPGWQRLRDDAAAAVSRVRANDGYYAAPQVAWITGPRNYDTDLPRNLGEVRWRMEARDDTCAHVRVVDGRCPRGPGEMMVANIDVGRGGYAVGSEADLGIGHRLTVVGSYVLDDPTSDFWYDPVRYVSTPFQAGRPSVPYTPSPFLVTPEELAALPAGDRVVRVDRALHPPGDLDQQELTALADFAAEEASRGPQEVDGGTLGKAEPVELASIRDDIETETDVAIKTILPASLSLIIVCVVLLFRLVAAAAELRRPEVALLKVRGWTGRRLRAVTLAEPLMLLIAGWVAGTVLAVPCASRLTDAWLRDGTPTTMSLAAGVMALLVLVVAVGAAVLATRAVATESLREQLETAAAPRPARRSVRILRTLVVVAAAVSVVLAVDAGDSSSPGVVGQSMPAIVGMATAVLTTALTLRAARWLVRRTSGRGSTVRFLQARAIARRRDGTLLVFPITVAMTVAVFAIGVWSTADHWRASAAAAEIGADRSYATSMNPVAAATLTHRIDPDGQWLMATALATHAGDLQFLVDSPRLTSVAEWPESWTGAGSLPAVSDELRPVDDPEIRGRTISVRATSRIDSDERMYATLALLDSSGRPHSASIGPFPRGQTVTRSTTVRACAEGCDVTGVQVGAVAGTLSPMTGTFTLADLVVDGRATDAFRDSTAWQSSVAEDADVEVGLTAADPDGTTLDIDSRGQQTSVLLQPDGTPVVPPALAGRDSPSLGIDSDAGVSTGPSAEYRLARVRTAEALPVVGSLGVMADLTTMTRASPKTIERQTRILATDDVPDSVIEELADAGVQTSNPMLLSDVRATYDNEAYALSLRLYMLAAAATLGLAIIGVVVSLAVQVRSRRKDAAALRVTGVRERSVWLAAVLELGAVIGIATVLGTLAGAGAAQVVVHGSRLGTVEVGTPRVLTEIDPTALALLCVAVFGVLAVVSALIARTVVRSGRPSALRSQG